MPETAESVSTPRRIHSFREVPASLADELVALLFDETHPSGRDSILYPEPVGDELINAVSRYFEDKSFTEPPEGVVVTPDPDVNDSIDAPHIVETVQEDFLGELTSLDSEFDYVLSATPRVEWGELTQRQQREYAQVSAQVKPGDEVVNTELLFTERGLHFLGDRGHAAFLTTTDLKTDEATNRFLAEIARDTEFVEAIDTGEYDSVSEPHMVFRVQGSGFSTRQHDNRRYQPNPTSVERHLFTAAGQPRADQTAQGIATGFDDLDLYAANAAASFVYFDMLYEDYDTALIVDGRTDDIISGTDVNTEDVRGFVAREEITLSEPGQINAHEKQLDENLFLAPDLPLSEILNVVGSDGTRFRYVGSPEEVHGLVTRFDLNKFPVYQYFYEMFAQFEIGLRRLIREEAPGWKDEVEEVYITSKGGPKLVSDELAEGKLRDLINIIQEIGLERSILTDIQGYEADIEQLNTLRSVVAHYNPVVHTMTDEGPEDKRSAPQLQREHKLLADCISGLSGS